MGQIKIEAPGETTSTSNMPDTPKVLTHHEEFDDDDDEDSDETVSPITQSPFFPMQSWIEWVLNHMFQTFCYYF